MQTSGASPTTEQSSIEEESSSSSSVVEKVQKVDEDIDVREYYHSEFGNGPALEDNDEVLESPVESRDENQSNKRSREEAFASHLLQFTSNQHSGVIVKEFTPKTQSAVSFKEIGFPRGPTEIPQQQQQVTPLPQRYYQGQFSSQKKRKSEPKQKREGFVKRHVNDQGHVVEIPVAWGPIPDASLYKKEAELPNEQKLQIWTSM